MTLAQVIAKLPTGPGCGYRGSWLGWFLRSALAPIIGIDDARDVVVRALGPGHDYCAPDNASNMSGRRNTVPRSDRGGKHQQKNRETSP